MLETSCTDWIQVRSLGGGGGDEIMVEEDHCGSGCPFRQLG